MKRRALSLQYLRAMLLMLALTGATRGLAAPPAPSTSPEIPPRSVFVLPTKPQEGRDPFFPDSSRPYEEAQAASATNAPSITDLAIKTILVNEHGQAFAIINDQTFGVGDEGDVITSTGRRIHIQCVDINPAKNTVTIESGDATVTLTYSGNQ